MLSHVATARIIGRSMGEGQTIRLLSRGRDSDGDTACQPWEACRQLHEQIVTNCDRMKAGQVAAALPWVLIPGATLTWRRVGGSGSVRRLQTWLSGATVIVMLGGGLLAASAQDATPEPLPPAPNTGSPLPGQYSFYPAEVAQPGGDLAGDPHTAGSSCRGRTASPTA